MPKYTLRNIKSSEEWDVVCTYSELQSMITEDVVQVLKPLNFVSNTATHANSGTSDGWKDLLGRIKKGSGRDNKIKT